MNLGFVILYVNDMERSKAFYTEKVGLTVVEPLSSPHFVTFQTEGGSFLALQDNATAQLPPRLEDHAGSVEISFAAEDVDGVWQDWKDGGVEIVAEPIDLPFGRYFMAKDPEGHYISVYRFAQQ